MVKHERKKVVRPKQSLKHVNIIVMVLLAFVTMGSYIGIWVLKRRQDIQNLTSKSSINYSWWRFFTIGLFVFLFLRIFGSIYITEFGMAFIESMDIIFSFFFVGLLYYSIFRIKELLEEKEMIDLNNYLLFFFHIFYIQYKVNREATKKL